MNKQSKRVSSLKAGEYLLEDNKQMASEFNSHFTSIADQFRSLLPQTNLDISKLIHFVIQSKMLASLSPFLLLKRAKASGIKLAAPMIAPSIAKLINYSFSKSVFPNAGRLPKSYHYLQVVI